MKPAKKYKNISSIVPREIPADIIIRLPKMQAITPIMNATWTIRDISMVRNDQKSFKFIPEFAELLFGGAGEGAAFCFG
jgi:hypothetical protein